jgi:hypothetical protein
MPFLEWSCSYCTVDLISWSVHCTMNLQRRSNVQWQGWKAESYVQKGSDRYADAHGS